MFQQSPESRLRELAAAAREQRLSADEATELNGMLEDSADLRKIFLQYELLQACLEMEMGREPAERTRVELNQPNWLVAAGPALYDLAVKPIALSMLVASLTITIILLSLALVRLSDDARPARVADQPQVRRDYVARIVNDADCQWRPVEQRDEPLSTGADLYAGERIELVEGAAEIAFDEGARIWIEGPTTLVLDQSDACLLESGRLTAAVPSRAIGFTVHTASAEMIDKGTHFAVLAEKSGRTELHVIEGKVLAQPPKGTDQSKFQFLLGAGDSMEFGVGALPSKIFDADVAAMFPRLADQQPEEQRHWEQEIEPWLDDPSLVAAWLCRAEDAVRHRLPNSAATDEQGRYAADSIAANWRYGRWSGKPALSFSGAGSPDRVEIANSQGDPFHFGEAFSISVWFRVERFEMPWQALVTKGDAAWRLHRSDKTNVLAFGTNGPDGANDLQGNTAVDDARWHHAVCVFERNEDSLVKMLYIDGKLDASEEVAAYELARIEAPVWIGNNAEQSMRTFHGQIDEVLLFNRALTAEETRIIFSAGVP